MDWKSLYLCTLASSLLIILTDLEYAIAPHRAILSAYVVSFADFVCIFRAICFRAAQLHAASHA